MGADKLPILLVFLDKSEKLFILRFSPGVLAPVLKASVAAVAHLGRSVFNFGCNINPIKFLLFSQLNKLLVLIFSPGQPIGLVTRFEQVFFGDAQQERLEPTFLFRFLFLCFSLRNRIYSVFLMIFHLGLRL